jgi:hypothetical protein
MKESTVVIWHIFTGRGDKITQIHVFEDTQDVVEYMQTTDALLHREHGAILQVFHGRTWVKKYGQEAVSLARVSDEVKY